MLISILGIAPLAKSNKFHNNTIQSLDKKKMIVTELTAACAGSSMALAAKAFGANGYFFEVHPDPDNALSDGPNMLFLDKLEGLVEKILE